MSVFTLDSRIFSPDTYPWGILAAKKIKAKPLVVYLFGNSSGDTVYDSSGNKNDGTKHGGIFVDNGAIYGVGYYTGAQGEYLSLSVAVDAYAIAFWLHDNYDPPDSDQVLTSEDSSLCLKTGTDGYFYLDNNTSMSVAGSYGRVEHTRTLNAEHVHVVLNYVDGKYDLYLNAEYKGHFTESPVMKIKYLGEKDSQSSYGGGDTYGAFRAFGGHISEQQIQDLYEEFG
jgi:hypothetical protein